MRDALVYPASESKRTVPVTLSDGLVDPYTFPANELHDLRRLSPGRHNTRASGAELLRLFEAGQGLFPITLFRVFQSLLHRISIQAGLEGHLHLDRACGGMLRIQPRGFRKHSQKLLQSQLVHSILNGAVQPTGLMKTIFDRLLHVFGIRVVRALLQNVTTQPQGIVEAAVLHHTACLIPGFVLRIGISGRSIGFGVVGVAFKVCEEIRHRLIALRAAFRQAAVDHMRHATLHVRQRRRRNLSVQIVEPSKDRVEPQAVSGEAYLSLEHIEAETRAIIGQGTAGDVKSTKTRFRSGDVLYGKLRPYLNKVCVPDFDGICSTDILVFAKRPNLCSKYLMHFLNRPSTVEHANHNSSGVQLPRVRFAELGKLGVSVPPLAEQERIVAAIERLTARVDAARRRLANVPQILKRFRQAILTAACSGRLVEDWRCSRGVDGEIPYNWRSVDFEQAIEGLEQGWSPKCEDHPSPSERVLGVIKTTAIQTMSFVEGENKQLPETLKPRPALELHAGDLLITRAGPRARAAIACMVETVRPKLICCDKAYRFRARADRAFAKYLLYFLNASTTLQLLDEMKTGISDSGVNLTQGKFRKLPLPLPPLGEQAEIVRRVEALMKLADAIERRVAAATARADKITQAVLAKAFRGELGSV